MTIEIKQLVIRAIVEPRHEAGVVEPAPRPGMGIQAAAAARVRAPREARLDREALIAACVRETMRELRKRRER